MSSPKERAGGKRVSACSFALAKPFAVASRELCWSRINANEEPVAESNLSLRVPAH